MERSAVGTAYTQESRTKVVMSALLQSGETLVRPMCGSDIDMVVDIERRSYEFPWSAGIFADCIKVGYCSQVLELDDGLSGYGIMSVASDESHILNVCIAPEARRKGCAKLLMSHLMKLAMKQGALKSYLEVRPSNVAAIALYTDIGFNHVGTRRAYYPASGGREDAYVLSVPLLQVVS